MNYGTKYKMYATKPMLERLNIALDMIGSNYIEISKKTGIDTTTLCKYRRGDRYPTVFNLIIISDESGFTIDWLIKGPRNNREY